MLFFTRYITRGKRTPHNEISNSVNKKITEDHDVVDIEEDDELPPFLQVAKIPSTRVSELERGLVFNDITKKGDEKRRKEIVAKTAHL